MTNLTLSASTKSSIFRILGTKQFDVFFSEDRSLSVFTKYRGEYLKEASSSFVYRFEIDENGKVNSRNLSAWYRNFVYQNRGIIKEQIKEIEMKLQEKARIEAKCKELEKKYIELVVNTPYYAPDLAYFVDKEDALSSSNVIAFLENPEWGSCRHSFIIELPDSKEVVRYDHVENCYYSNIDYSLGCKVEAVNFYQMGFNDGYDESFCDGMYSLQEKSPVRPLPEGIATQVYSRGFGDGGHRGYMDT